MYVYRSEIDEVLYVEEYRKDTSVRVFMSQLFVRTLLTGQSLVSRPLALHEYVQQCAIGQARTECGMSGGHVLLPNGLTAKQEQNHLSLPKAPVGILSSRRLWRFPRPRLHPRI